jgi:predicted acyl esterase
MKKMLRTSLARFLVVVVFCLGAQSISQAQTAANPGVTAKPPSEQMVAMRDGVKLATDVYLPEGTGPWPVVLTRTPYGKSILGPASSKLWIEHGYAFVMQDTRHSGSGEQ